MRKTKPNPKTPPIDEFTFADRLVLQLEALNSGKVRRGSMSDNSCSWVSIKFGKKKLEFCFTADGNLLTDIGLFKDVYEKVGEERIWGDEKS